jgi:hypothetical protein
MQLIPNAAINAQRAGIVVQATSPRRFSATHALTND